MLNPLDESEGIAEAPAVSVSSERALDPMEGVECHEEFVTSAYRLLRRHSRRQPLTPLDHKMLRAAAEVFRSLADSCDELVHSTRSVESLAPSRSAVPRPQPPLRDPPLCSDEEVAQPVHMPYNEGAPASAATGSEMSTVGLPSAIVDVLKEHGLSSLEQLRHMTDEQLQGVPGIGPARLQLIRKTLGQA